MAGIGLGEVGLYQAVTDQGFPVPGGWCLNALTHCNQFYIACQSHFKVGVFWVHIASEELPSGSVNAKREKWVKITYCDNSSSSTNLALFPV